MAQAFGLELADLPDGWAPLEVIAIVKCVDVNAPDGKPRHNLRSTAGLDVVEALGMAEVAADLIRADTLATFHDEDDD